MSILRGIRAWCLLGCLRCDANTKKNPHDVRRLACTKMARVIRRIFADPSAVLRPSIPIFAIQVRVGARRIAQLAAREALITACGCFALPVHLVQSTAKYQLR